MSTNKNLSVTLIQMTNHNSRVDSSLRFAVYHYGHSVIYFWKTTKIMLSDNAEPPERIYDIDVGSAGNESAKITAESRT